MKRQNAKLESMAAKLEDNSKEVSELKEQLKTMHERGSRTAETEDVRRGPVPKELKVCGNFTFRNNWVDLRLNVVYDRKLVRFGSSVPWKA